MSYDLESPYDDQYSQALSRDKIPDIVRDLEHLEHNGPGGFVFNPDSSIYMEIDFEYVSNDGDSLEETELMPDFNCIRFYIPYTYGDGMPACIDRALVIAQKAGWPLCDLQTGQHLNRENVQKLYQSFRSQQDIKPQKPWWKFW